MLDTVADEIKDYIESIYGLADDDRIFTRSAGFYRHELERGAKEGGVKRLSPHELRHPYVKRKTKKFANPFGARSERFSQHPVLSLGAA